MENTHNFTGKTVEEAVEAGLNALNVTREEVEIEVIEEGKVRKIGKSVPAEVKITVKEVLTDGGRAVKFLEGLFRQLGEEVVPVLESEDEKIIINLQAVDGKGLIGKRGEIIDAVQTLAGAVANTGRKDYKRVVVDHGNYRERREETLTHVAEKLAAKALRLGKRVRLEPMNPYERRIIHAALMNSEEVTTHSEGKEPNRYVVITPKNVRIERHGDKYGRNGHGGKNNKGHGNDNRNRYGDKYGDKKPYPKRKLPTENTPQSSGTTLRTGGGTAFKRTGFSGFFGTYLGNSRDDGNNEE